MKVSCRFNRPVVFLHHVNLLLIKEISYVSKSLLVNHKLKNTYLSIPSATATNQNDDTNGTSL